MFWRYFRSNSAAVFGILLTLGGLGVAGKGGYEAWRIQRFGGDVYEAQGTVASVYSSGRRRSSTRAEIVYEDRNGLPHRFTKSVGRNTTGVGQRIGLWVSAIDPEQNWDAADGRPMISQTYSWFGGGGALLGVGVLLIVIAAEQASRRSKVLRQGVPATGQIVRIDERYNRKARTTTYFAIYEWTLRGQRYEGRTLPLNAMEVSGLAPGMQVPVFIDPSNPAAGEIDVFGYRRAA